MISPAYAEPGPLSVPFSPGEIIAEKYEFVGLLGSGGVAYVVSALHLELGEMVALKFLRPESLAYEDVVARFASEARAVARIKSEHVAHVYDVGSLPDGAPFIVMEYLEGKDLADTLAEQRKLPVKVAVDYVLQACEALACAHAGGIVHRDIKPENLFLMQQAGSVEVIKVLDFGISKSAMAAVGSMPRRSAKTTLPMGTPGYMSPEQIRACGNVDARTDIWAIGCVLSELICGASTFEAPTQVQLGAVILESDPVPLRKRMPEVPAELEAIVLKCLAKKPDDRYQDVAELALALYPFGPRRSRLSAERCHQVLRGQSGVVIEFNSVPPPQSGDTPMPVSSTAGIVSAVPSSLGSPPPLRTSTPTTLSAADHAEFRPKRRGLVAGAVIAVSAAFGIGLGLRANSGANTGPAAAAAMAAPAGAPTVAATNARTSTVAPRAAPAPDTARTEPVIGDATATPDPDAGALMLTAPHATAPLTAAQRAKLARAQRAAADRAAREAAAAAPKPKPAKRIGLDDAEPDVGY